MSPTIPSALVERLADAFVALDAERRCTYLNAAAAALCGHESAGAIGRPLAELLPEPMRAVCEAAVERAWLARTPLQVELEAGRPPRWLELRVYPGTDGLTLLFADATARHAAEEAHRRQVEGRAGDTEERFRTVVEALGEGILITDLEDRILYTNTRNCEITGYSRDELVGRIGYELLVPPEELDAFKARIARRVHGVSGRYQMPQLRKDGRRIWTEVHGSPLRNAEGEIVGTVGAITDITDRKLAEEQLRRQALVFEVISDGVLLTDGDDRIIEWNPAAERIFGFSRPEALGRTPAEMLGAVWPPGGREAVVDELRRRGAWTGQCTSRHRDGREVVCEATVLPLLDDSGELAGLLSVTRDVSERKQLEAQLRQAQKMEAVGRLAGGVAHDFNNLLLAITGFATLLEEEIAVVGESGVYLREILKAADRAASLTQQLLAFARRQTMQLRVLSLNDVVADAQRLLRRLVPANIAIETELDPAAGQVKVDPSQVQQVLMNLVVNARDAMERGGIIRIATGRRRISGAERDAEQALTPGEYVELTVADSGNGIEPDVLPQIFEPFFTTKPAGMGTGLGLSTVYGIVTQSGGHVWASSAPGTGTRFTILLPRQDEPAARPAQPAQLRPGHRGNGTVLLVEDDPTVRRLACRILVRSGYAVLEAADGAQALELFGDAAAGIDLLVTDVVMPNLGGEALARQLRRARTDLKVVFMSGYAGDALAEAAELPPGTRFLHKPFRPETLVSAVREMLGG